jgi:hypothetical protein
MGQEETIKLVIDLKFTTLKELIPLLQKDMGKDSITKALARLVKHGEIISIKMTKEQIYISKDFYDGELK